MSDLATLGERVKWAREAAGGISARRLDDLAGLAHGHVAAIEETDPKKGRPNPSGATVAKLAEALGVSTDWLLCRPDAKEPSPRRIKIAVKEKIAARSVA